MKKKISPLILCLIFLFITLSFAVLTTAIMKNQTVLTGTFGLIKSKNIVVKY